MQTIWKFPLEIADEQTVSMPAGAEPLFAGMQGGTPCVWAAVDTEAAKEPVRFFVIGTGNPMPDDAVLYIGSVFDRSFVWHIYTE